MSLIEPIIVYGPARSGTSLITGIIHLCGAWVGPYRKNEKLNPKGSFELQGFKTVLTDKMSVDTNSVTIREIMAEYIENIGYPGGPWVLKVKDSLHWIFKKGFSPKWVLVWRKQGAILQSQERSYITKNKEPGFFDKAIETEKIISKHKYMSDMYNEDPENVFNIWPEKIIKGNYRDLENMINWLGLSFNYSKIKDFIDPAFWHFK